MDFFICVWFFFIYFDNLIEWEMVLLNDIVVRVNILILIIFDNVNIVKRFGF